MWEVILDCPGALMQAQGLCRGKPEARGQRQRGDDRSREGTCQSSAWKLEGAGTELSFSLWEERDQPHLAFSQEDPFQASESRSDRQ